MPFFCSLRRSTVALLLVATAGAAAAQTPPAPKPGPEALDAWGRTIDVDAKVREQLAAKVAAKMGSPDWVPVAFRVLDIHGGILPRMHWAAGLDLQCGKRYRREHPEVKAEQYSAFLASAAGQAWEKTCVTEQLADPNVDPRLVDGMIASIEVGFMLPQILQAIQQSRVKEGLTGTPPAISPTMEEKLPAVTEQAFAMSRCLLGKALEEMPIAKALAEPDLFQAAIVAAMKAGVCSAPKPAAAGG